MKWFLCGMAVTVVAVLAYRRHQKFIHEFDNQEAT